MNQLQPQPRTPQIMPLPQMLVRGLSLALFLSALLCSEALLVAPSTQKWGTKISTIKSFSSSAPFGPNFRLSSTRLFDGENPETADSTAALSDQSTSSSPASLSSSSSSEATIREESSSDSHQTLEKQGAALEGLRDAFQNLQQVLKKKEAELQQKQDVWSQEKTSLIAKIAEVSSTLMKIQKDNPNKQLPDDDDDETQAQIDAERLAEQDRLKREIQLLNSQMARVKERLETEEARNQELKRKVDKVNDSLEFEQMLFFKEKEQLKEQLGNQLRQIASIENKLKREEAQILEDREALEMKLKEEKERVQRTRAELKDLEQEYRKGQQVLKDNVRQEEKAIRQAERELRNQKRAAESERKEMQMQVEQDQERISKLQEEIREETESFNSLQPKLEQTIKAEQQKVDQLSQKLVENQERYESEKAGLEGRIVEERKRLKMVQDRLAKERTKAEQTRLRMLFQQSIVEAKREDDRSRMRDRFDGLRQSLTDKYYETKRQGKLELKDLKLKYENDIDMTKDNIQNFKDQLNTTRASRDNLQATVDDMNLQAQRAEQDKVQTEQRYQKLLVDRNSEIASLHNTVQVLELTEKETADEIAKVEASYREIAKMSVRLTGRRIGKLNPLRFFRRRGRKD